MDFFSKEEFELLNSFAGKGKTPELQDIYDQLKTTYYKVQYWAKSVKEDLFPFGEIKLRKSPINQGNRFEGYLWSKIYPTKEEFNSNQLAYTVRITKDQDYIINIDTIGLLEKDPLRKSYYELRSQYPIVHRFLKNEVNDWSSLLEKSNKAIISMQPYFDLIKKNLFNIEDKNSIMPTTNINDPNITKSPSNLILYGPPGTGKTYHTINKAISIANPSFDISQDREILKTEYDRLIKDGQIVFTTFHQSMTYEDFIEGIKPEIFETDNNKSVIYDTQDGVFKQLVNTAKGVDGVVFKNVDWDNVDYYKMSLGGKTNPLEHDYCISNNVAGITWGGNNDLSALASISNWNTYRDTFKRDFPEDSKERYNIQASYILNKMKIGDIVIATKGNHNIDAIGRVEGDYFFNDDNTTSLQHFRKINWLVKNLNTKPGIFFKKNISQQSIYQFDKKDINIGAFESLNISNKRNEKKKNYVLIIDEINRGNISAIFGELITLIEESKRAGNEEALEVILPYSKEKFSVPSNVYIIGTMNTADRSVEALDTALRRRFSFEEMMPDYSLVELQYDLFGYDSAELLKTINERICVLLDREHQIGHSYFIGKDEKSILDSFYKNIIPLLQEYFFGDYGKIGLVLGEGFVRKIEHKSHNILFAKFSKYSDANQYDEVERFEIIPKNEVNINMAIQSLMN